MRIGLGKGWVNSSRYLWVHFTPLLTLSHVCSPFPFMLLTVFGQNGLLVRRMKEGEGVIGSAITFSTATC